ncbi:MAG: hypothetical protein IPK17_17580 [Chloroflexi bacterium]|uniref:hypothetical protein n=1 Tax=Candidatus Flexifilum breve TaxID=3140694 RepID=UPI0031365D59|nr:hypothetical protein [Chloroflexota bacterium]
MATYPSSRRSACWGWYHSHPGFGVFLSGMDLGIHNQFFTHLWQLAVVIDPIQRHYGIFLRNPASALASGISDVQCGFDDCRASGQRLRITTYVPEHVCRSRRPAGEGKETLGTSEEREQT